MEVVEQIHRDVLVIEPHDPAASSAAISGDRRGRGQGQCDGRALRDVTNRWLTCAYAVRSRPLHAFLSHVADLASADWLRRCRVYPGAISSCADGYLGAAIWPKIGEVCRVQDDLEHYLAAHCRGDALWGSTHPARLRSPTTHTWSPWPPTILNLARK